MNQRIFFGSLTLACYAFSFSLYAQLAKNAPISKKSEKEYSHQKPFSMTAPKGWECIDDKKQLPAKVELVFIGTGKGQFTPSINLATENTEMTMQEYVKLAKQYHESQGETKCRSLGALDTKEGPAELLQIDRQTQWGPVRFIQASLIKQGTAYVITATCLQEDFNEFSSSFFKAIQTFTINQL